MLQKNFQNFTEKYTGEIVNVRIKPKAIITGTLTADKEGFLVKNREGSVRITAEIVRNISIADAQKKRKEERKKKAV